MDLLAILPFYFSTVIDLRSIRIFRLLRLLKLFYFNQSIIIMKKAFIKIKSELLVFFSLPY